MTTALIFPGQGSQAVGMGRALAEAYPVARAVFDEVDDALGQKLSAIMRDGPEADLTLTENAQPALMAVSLATMRVLEAEGVRLGGGIAYVAGHSLGEYSALAAAGAFSIADAARLLRIRGRAMQQAVPVGEGAMAALLGLDFDTAVAVAREAAGDGDVCDAANDNADGQVVVSGSRAAVGRAVELAKARGAKRAMMLNVSAPFHCALMRPAAEVMARALAGVTVTAPVVPLVANVTAAPVSDPEEIRRRLVEQVTGTVRWRESVRFLAGAGVTRLYEVGSGKVLTGLVKRIVEGVEAVAVNTPEDVEKAAAALA
jgi:[acyl-carrier-protein] S-malonyltransferase